MQQGEKHNRLTAIEKGTKSGKWFFLCDCGNTKELSVCHVLAGTTKSCGCLHLELCAKGANRLKHGDARTGEVKRLHEIWRGMLKRCNPQNKSSKGYADRGISVCGEWGDYLAFKKWALGSGYNDTLSIDRIDNNENYSPQNCRWITMSEQARNRRTSRFITAFGETKTLSEFAQKYNVPYARVQARIFKLGWSAEEALTKRKQGDNDKDGY